MSWKDGLRLTSAYQEEEQGKETAHLSVWGHSFLGLGIYATSSASNLLRNSLGYLIVGTMTSILQSQFICTHHRKLSSFCSRVARPAPPSVSR